MEIDKITLVVKEYDPAISFFVNHLGFDLIEDSPATTTVTGKPKRWVVVRPPNTRTGLLLAKADGEIQSSAVGNQTGGRVGFFLQVEDFDSVYEKLVRAEVEIIGTPRTEVYGKVVVFRDLEGNKWDLIGKKDAG